MTDYKSPTTFKLGTTQTVAVGNSSAATSNAFSAQTREIRIVTTVDAYVEMNATSPTASSSSIIVPAFTPEYFRVTPGTKVALLRVGSTDGTSRVTELSQWHYFLDSRKEDKIDIEIEEQIHQMITYS